jgi:hypothetical protein
MDDVELTTYDRWQRRQRCRRSPRRSVAVAHRRKGQRRRVDKVQGRSQWQSRRQRAPCFWEDSAHAIAEEKLRWNKAIVCRDVQGAPVGLTDLQSRLREASCPCKVRWVRQKALLCIRFGISSIVELLRLCRDEEDEDIDDGGHSCFYEDEYECLGLLEESA